LKDAETEAEGWTVINSSWWCRRWNQDEKRIGHQCFIISKTMEVKFTVSTSYWRANPELISIQMILEKKAFYNVGTSGISIIKSYYGTGGDLNVDEIHEVIP
jgi:hypothetical protein